MHRLVKMLKSAFQKGIQTEQVVSRSHSVAYYNGLRGVSVILQTYLLNIARRHDGEISVEQFSKNYYALVQSLFSEDEVPMVARRYGDSAVLIANWDTLHFDPMKADGLQLWMEKHKISTNSMPAIAASDVMEGLYGDAEVNLVLISLAETARSQSFEAHLARRLYYMLGAAHVSATIARFKQQISAPLPTLRSKSKFVGDMKGQLSSMSLSAQTYTAEHVLKPASFNITGVDPKVGAKFVISAFAPVPSSISQFITIMQILMGTDEYLEIAREASNHVGNIRSNSIAERSARNVSLNLTQLKKR